MKLRNILVISTCKEKLHELEFVKPIEDILLKEGVKYITKSYLDISIKDLKDSWKIIICGTSLRDFDYLNNIKKFNWIKKFDKPIMGICAGMQILISIFHMNEKTFENSVIVSKEIGFTTIIFKKNFLGLSGKKEVYSLHNLGIYKSGRFFEKFASSSKGIQAIKHKEKPFYGLLFHPEVRNKYLIKEFINNA